MTYAALLTVVALFWHTPALQHSAMKVAWCESRYLTTARNGQFRGLFQLGRRERREYGYGRSARAQVRGAFRLWKARGWEPWACRP